MSKVTRCMWCGTIESSNWVYTRYNEVYCSKDCFYANKMEMNGLFGFCCGCIIPLLVIAIIMMGGLAPELILMVSICCLLSAVFIYAYSTGRRVRREVPKQSRQS